MGLDRIPALTPAVAEMGSSNKSNLKDKVCPGGVPQLAGLLSCKPKGCRFDSWSGDTPRLEAHL